MDKYEHICAECHHADPSRTSGTLIMCTFNHRWCREDGGKMCGQWKPKKPEPTGAVRYWPD